MVTNTKELLKIMISIILMVTIIIILLIIIMIRKISVLFKERYGLKLCLNYCYY